MQPFRFFASIILVALVFGSIASQAQISREKYEEFLNNHAFSTRERLTDEELKKIPKNTRPDLAYEQDYLRTLDPATGKPEPTRLLSVFQQTALATQQQALVPGIPGSATFPWVERGPNNVAGRTRALVWDPNAASGNKVWAGGVTGGLWYNDDITSSTSQWQAVNDFWDNIAVTCMAFDPNNSQIAYVGTGESFTGASRGAGIWKTTDGGNSWSQLPSTTNFFYVNDIVVQDSSGTSKVYAAVDGRFYNGTFHGTAQAGLQRSADGGATWTQVLPNVPGETINFVADDIEIAANDRIWIGSGPSPFSATNRGGGYILYSDNGTNWTISLDVGSYPLHTITNGRGRVELACAPSNANVVYALIENDLALEAVFKTITANPTQGDWSSSTTDPNISEPNDDDNGIPASDFTRGQAFYDLIAAVDPLNENAVIVGGINLHRSTNGGQSWSQISKWSNNPGMGGQPYSLVHADQHAITFKPGQTGFAASEVIFGTDGGVYYTNNVGLAANSDVISGRNNGYNVTQFYSAALSPTAGSNHILGGTQDNGTQEFTTSGMNSTTEKWGGDGGQCFIDQTEPNIQIVSYVYNNFDLFNGASYEGSILADDNSGSFINVADYDDNQNALYSYKSNSKLYKVTGITTSSTGNIDSIVHNFQSTVTALKVSPHTTASTKLFVGTQSGRLFEVTNANTSGYNVSEITPGAFPNASISSIEFGPTENQILVTFFNYGAASVWYTPNGGTTWVNKEGSGATAIPDMPVRWGLINPNDTNQVILATEVGVWSTSNKSAPNPVWDPSSSGLANVRVDMLQIRDSDQEVIAATHGRGMFSSPAFANISGLNLIANTTQPSCGANSGSISISVNGGTSPYSFTWNTGDTTATLANIGAGTYSVTVSDAASATDSTTVTLNTVGQVISSLPYNESFESGFGNWYNDSLNDDIDWLIDNTSTTSSGTGPTGPNDGLFYARIEASSNFGSAPGDIAYLVSGCADLSNASNPFISFFNHQFSQTSDPTLTLEIDTGNGVWVSIFSQTGNQGNQWNADTVDLSNFIGTTATFRFSAEVGTAGSFFQSDISIDKVYISATPPAFVSYDVDQPNCYGANSGSITVNASGGTGNITYLWNTGDTANSISNLTAGLYSVTVFDGSIPVDSNTFEIYPINSAPAHQFSTSFENSFDGFFNVNDDDLDWFFETGATPTGGTGPTGPFDGNAYLRIESSAPNVGTAIPGDVAELISPCFDLSISINPFVSFAKHSWSLGNNNPILSFWGDTSDGDWFVINADTGDLGFNWLLDTFDLTPFSGKQIRFKFTARVADQGLQQRSDMAIDNFYFSPYPELAVDTALLVQGNCHTGTPGSIFINPSGGVSPYSYNWSNGDTTAFISNLTGGNYSVTVSDQVGQSAVYSTFINGDQALQTFPYNEGFENGFGYWLNEGLSDNIDFFVDSGATATFTTGPNAPSSGNYYIRIEASAPPNGNASPGDTAILNGPCFDLSAATLPYIAFDYHQFSDPAFTTNCQLVLAADSGNGNWFNLFSRTGDQGNQWNSDTVFLNQFIGKTLKFRFYAIVGTTGFPVSSDIALDKIFVTLHDPLVLANSAIVQPTCGASDGQIGLSMSGGQTPYSYIWSNGAVTDTVSNLSPGSYSVTVTDIFSQTYDTTFVIGNPGTLPYSYDWENGLNGWQQETTTDDFDWALQTGPTTSGNTGPTSANTGFFYIYTEASAPRQNNDSAIIYSPCFDLGNLPAPHLSFEYHQFGNSSMSIEILADSGDGIWNSLFFSQGDQGNQWNLDSAELFYYIDKNVTFKIKGIVLAQGGGQLIWQGDNALDEIKVDPGLPLQFTSAITSDPLCASLSDGSIDVSVLGGYKPYAYAWSNGDSIPNPQNLTAGTYSVTVSDKYGRQIDTTLSIANQYTITSNSNTSNETCFGSADGSILATAFGSPATPYVYNWSNSQSGANQTGLSAGNFSVTITDQNGCFITDSDTVLSPLPIQISATIQDENCAGASNGSISLTPTGGNGLFSFSWNTGDTTNSITGLAPNTYSVTVTDQNSCSADSSFVVQQSTSSLATSISTSNVSCNGGNNGAATVTATGTATPFIFNWSSSSNATNIETGLTAGTYTVSTSDQTGCTVTDTFTITQPNPIALTFDSVADQCQGANIIALNANPAGGIFSGQGVSGSVWNTSGLTAGIYTLKYIYTDTSSCVDSISQQVEIDSLPNAQLPPLGNYCVFDSIVNLTQGSPSGGQYVFNGNVVNSFNTVGLAPGTYTVKYRVSGGCGIDSASNTFQVLFTPTVNAGADQFITSGSAATLNGSGTVNATTVSIWQPDTLVVSPSLYVTQTVPLTSNTKFYLGAVSFSTGCAAADSMEVIIIPQAIQATASVIPDTICEGDSAQLNTTVQGAQGAVSYNWSPGNFVSDSTIANPLFTGLATSNLNVIVDDGLTKDTAFVSVQVNPTPNTTLLPIGQICINEPAFNLSGGNPVGGVYSINGTPATQLDPNLLGVGNQVVSYTFSNTLGCTATASRNVLINSVPNATLAAFSDVCDNGTVQTLSGGSPAGGTYFVNGVASSTFNPSSLPSSNVITYVVSNGVGCLDSTTQTFSVNPAPTVFAGNDTTLSVGSSFNFSSAVSGNNLSILWAPDTNLSSGSAVSPQVQNILTSTTYSLTATDSATGCGASDQINVSVSGGTLSLLVNSTANNICEGDSVSLSALASGGTGNYTYQWTPDSTLNSDSLANVIGFPSSTTTYFVTVSDGNTSTSKSMVINVNPLPQLSVPNVGTFCENDSVSALPMGSPSGGTYSGSGVLASQFSPLVAGSGSHPITYTFTDGNGCTNSAQTTIIVNAQPNVSLSSLPEACENGANVLLTQGLPLGGAYFGNGVVGGQFDPSIGAGMYPISYTFTDSNGCSNSSIDSILVNPLPSVNAGVDQSISAGTSTTLFGTGSSSSGSPNISWTPASLLANPTQLTAPTLNLANSTQFTLTLTDTVTGCSNSDQMTVFVTGGPLTVSLISSTDTICSGDSISLQALAGGGSGQYSYSWSNTADTNASITLNPTFSSWYKVTISDTINTVSDSVFVVANANPPVALNLPSTICENDNPLQLNQGFPTGGIYSGNGIVGNTFDPLQAGLGDAILTYTFSDPLGCSSSASDTITVNSIPSVSLNLSPDSICNSAGAVNLSGGLPSGGNYIGTGIVANQFDPTGLTQGAYQITYQATQNGCSASASSFIQVVGGPQISLVSQQDVSCFGASDGQLNISISQGVPSYVILWQNGDTTTSLQNLSPGTYQVTVGDQSGCSAVQSYTISQPAQVVPTLNVKPITCSGDQDAAITAVTTGGASPFSFQWSVAGNGATVDSLAAGSYAVTITDANNCLAFAGTTISNPPVLSLSLNGTNLSCNNSADGLVSSTVLGGNSPYTFGWSNGDSTANISGLAAGKYVLQINDSNGCSLKDSVTLSEPAPIFIQAINLGADTFCSGSNTDLTANPPIGFVYQWKLNGLNISGATNPQYIANSSGKYTVQVTDASGCKGISNGIDLVVLPNPTIDLSGIRKDYCTSETAIPLTGLPAGGAFSGTGITNNIFNPSTIGVGTSNIKYVYEDQNGCSDSTIKQVTIQNGPQIGSLLGPLKVQPNSAITYQVFANNGSSYQWFATGGSVLSFINNVATVQWGVAGMGELTVVETNSIGCTDSLSNPVEIGARVGVNEYGQIRNILLFPNPVASVLNVGFENFYRDNLLVDVINMQGQVVMKQNVVDINGPFTTKTLDVSQLPSGVYFISFVLDETPVKVPFTKR